MHGEGYRYGAQNEQQLPYVFERVMGILRQRRVARQEASPGVAEHPMVVSDDLTNASFDLRSESFNAQLHRGAIIYVIKASGQNVLLLRATSAYRYVGCRGIVSPHRPFDGDIISLVQWWCKRKTPIVPRPDSTPARLLHLPKKGDSSNAAIHSSIATFGSRISDFGVRNIVSRLTR